MRWINEEENRLFVDMIYAAGHFNENGDFVVNLETAAESWMYKELIRSRSVGAIKTQIYRVRLRLQGIRHEWSENSARNFDRFLFEKFPHHRIPDIIEYVCTGIKREHKTCNKADYEYDHSVGWTPRWREEQMVGTSIFKNLSGGELIDGVCNWFTKMKGKIGDRFKKWLN